MENNFLDIEREIEKRFIIGMREVFAKEDEFRYNDKENESRVLITTTYPEKDNDYLTPQIVVRDISYSIDAQASFNNNMLSTCIGSDIVNYGSNHRFSIPYSMTLNCCGIYDESRNLANTLVYILGFKAYDYFSNYFKLNLKTYSKSPTSPLKQFPEKVFQTVVSVTGMLVVEVTKHPYNYMDKNKSIPIDKLGVTFNKENIKLETKSNKQERW